MKRPPVSKGNLMHMSAGVKYILLSTIFFALMNVGVKFLDNIPTYEIVFFRALVTLIAGYILLKRAGLKPWGNSRLLLICRGLAGTAALIMYFYTLQNMPLASAVTIQYLSPIFTIIIAGIMLKETPRSVQWIFFAIAFSGVLLLKGFDARVSPTELAVGILAAVFSGLAYNFIRKLNGRDDPLVVVFYFPLVTVPIVGSYTLFHWVTPSPLEGLILILIGLATTAAQIFMTRAYQLERAADISIFNYLGSIYAILIGFFLFGEIISLMGLVGIGLILGGVILSSRFRSGETA